MNLFLIFFLAIFLAGCRVGPVYEPPQTDIHCEWATPLPENLTDSPSDSFIWWESFQDPILNSLISRAASQNLDLRTAALRILETRLEKQDKQFAIYPRIDFSANYDHLRYGKKTIDQTVLGCRQELKRSLNLFEIGFDATWEIDFFGLAAHEVEALKALEESAEYNLHAIWATLSAEIAKNYIDLRSLQQQLKLLDQRIDLYNHSLCLVRQLNRAGIQSAIDLNQSAITLETLQAQRPLLALDISKAINHLSILLGCMPGSLNAEFIDFCALPSLLSQTPIGTPSQLLRRRPDIRKAERELAAATERVGSAIAALFPRFSLNGFAGNVSTQAGHLLDPASFVLLAGPQLSIPIFNSKLIIQDVNYNKIQTKKALYGYQNTVLKAVEETENSIASYDFEHVRHQHLADSCAVSQKNLNLNQELYKRGLVDQLTVLKYREAALLVESALLQSQTTLLLHYISLYKALGGHW